MIGLHKPDQELILLCVDMVEVSAALEQGATVWRFGTKTPSQKTKLHDLAERLRSVSCSPVFCDGNRPVVAWPLLLPTSDDNGLDSLRLSAYRYPNRLCV